ncbi:MAG: hypothetical protein COZ70_13205 [Deltaproteobacteria bacterium CG_4_8_14_3_um_filter_51_11]|nr:MAG: hypothetical protein COX16_03110 [Deltaproteobacteria bacterium CG23_combo_of_CG06-09_8_20_14_all_51_20]PIX18628.1 MAG: hypothetical protein COZ70_13205 [Deltaproteobacteria bacterium CG_4_8_14_3_um_filter_51_11]PIY26815.1 MAG: hypothetical protein COZ11_01715 [Deltaproteobacteria bacterium CG_4_10_14_3_um_filter_51_14]
MPHVIPDLIRSPGINDWIPAYAGMTMYLHKKTCQTGKSKKWFLVIRHISYNEIPRALDHVKLDG